MFAILLALPHICQLLHEAILILRRNTADALSCSDRHQRVAECTYCQSTQMLHMRA